MLKRHLDLKYVVIPGRHGRGAQEVRHGDGGGPEVPPEARHGQPLG